MDWPCNGSLCDVSNTIAKVYSYSKKLRYARKRLSFSYSEMHELTERTSMILITNIIMLLFRKVS